MDRRTGEVFPQRQIGLDQRGNNSPDSTYGLSIAYRSRRLEHWKDLQRRLRTRHRIQMQRLDNRFRGDERGTSVSRMIERRGL